MKKNWGLFLVFLVISSCATNIDPVIDKAPKKAAEPVLSAENTEITETKERITESAEQDEPISVFQPESAEQNKPLSLFQPDFLTIIAAGDNLYHDVMIRAGEEGDYETAYKEIIPLVEKADIAFINQETVLAGKSFGFSGYPQFNSPQALGRAIAATGFNLVNQANNHIMDKGEKAVFATLDFWSAYPEITTLGIHRNAEERALPKIIKKNNIAVGFLSYTYGTNGLAVPKDKPYLVSIINTEIMKKEIEAIRPLCDFLVVSMHWGEEYQHNYNKAQKNLAAFLAENMVDLVIGHHPHVIQAIENIERPDGKFMLCFYSLGNFLSAQTYPNTLAGAMAYIKIMKLDSVEITEAGAIPVVTHYEKNYTGFKVYPLYEYTTELANKHRRNQAGKELTIEYLSELNSRIFGDKEIKQNPFLPQTSLSAKN